MKMNIFDGLRSLIGNLGDPSRDKSASVYYINNDIPDQQLMAAFETNWIAEKIVLIPVADSTRKWRNWTGEHGAAMKAEEKRLDVRAKVFEAAWKGRLFGGAAIYIGTDQEASEPLNVDAIKLGGLKYLTVLARNELIAGELEQDPLSPFYNRPKDYTISGSTSQVVIHPSRLVLFNGKTKPDPKLSTGASFGWGNSSLKSVHDTIAQSGGAFASVASLVFEANVDVIGIPDLMDNIGDKEYESALIKRFQLAAANKGINGSLLMDSKETYERKTASFAQLPEIMQVFAMLCSAAADIPATRFLAQSPTGLNSSGESDMANYHDMIQSMQSVVIEPAMALLDQCLVRSALGNPSEDAVFEWNPLKQMNEKELAEIGKLTMETLEKMAEYLTDEEIRVLTVHKMSENGVFPHIESVVADTKEGLEV